MTNRQHAVADRTDDGVLVVEVVALVESTDTAAAVASK